MWKKLVRIANGHENSYIRFQPRTFSDNKHSGIVKCSFIRGDDSLNAE